MSDEKEVERIAKRLWRARCDYSRTLYKNWTPVPWDDLDPVVQGACRAMARAIIADQKKRAKKGRTKK